MQGQIRQSSRAGKRATRIMGTWVVHAALAVAASGAAHAQCAVAGLQTASTDLSTSQALELIRDRRMQVAVSCPAGSMPSAAGGCVPVSPAATQPAAAPQAAPAQRRVARPAAPRPMSGGGGGYGGLKDYGMEDPRVVSYGVWAEGFGDRERRNDVSDTDGATTGRQDIRSTTVGVMSGVDHTYMRSGREGVMIGALGGYSHSINDFSGSTVSNPKKQDIDAGIVGLYATYFHGGLALDILAKADIFDLEQRTTCVATATGSTDGASYTLAGNIYHRRDFGTYWIEPTAGFRYLHTEFGSGATALGLDEGNALRLQAGVRVGRDWVGTDGRLWGISFLAGVYSDVLVDGFAVGAGGSNTVLESDEGKVRALGQLRGKVTSRDGVTLYGQAEVRGGEDYIGVGGKLGIRYEW
jgi:hypothetical protein